MDKLLFTMEEAVEMTGLSKSTLYKLTASKSISHYKPMGKLIFFSKEQLMDLLTKKKIATMEEIKNEVGLNKR